MLTLKSNPFPYTPSFWLLGMMGSVIMVATNLIIPTNIVAAPVYNTKVDRLAAVAPQASVYWIQGTGNMHLIARPVDTPVNPSSDLALATAFNQLLSSPQTETLKTTIPKGTQLLGLRTERNTIYINLSAEFATGGGSTSMTQRVAQVLYTATSLDSKARVYLFINGEPVNEEHPLGGEGLLLPHPLTREQFDEMFPR